MLLIAIATINATSAAINAATVTFAFAAHAAAINAAAINATFAFDANAAIDAAHAAKYEYINFIALAEKAMTYS